RGRPPVSGLRIVRSMVELRGARRCLPVRRRPSPHRGGGMTLVARTDTSVIGRWWWTVDRWALATLAALMVIGAWLVVTASPSVAERLGYDSFHFAQRHLIMLPAAAAVMFGTSLLSPRGVLRVAAVLFAVSLLLLAAV